MEGHLSAEQTLDSRHKGSTREPEYQHITASLLIRHVADIEMTACGNEIGPAGERKSRCFHNRGVLPGCANHHRAWYALCKKAGSPL